MKNTKKKFILDSFKDWKDPRYKNLEFLIKKICVNSNCSIKDTIISMNKSALQVAVIINERKKYLGIITDGDIRRGIIKKIPITNNIKKILKKNSLTVKPNVSRESARRLMEDRKIFHLPIVNNKGFFQGIHLNDGVITSLKKYQNTVLIMAGGLGKRLRPLTLKTPKPMLNYKNKPIIEHIIKNFNKEGFTNFYISTGYLGHKIRNYFKDGSEAGLNIKYINEKKPLGTAGSLAFIKKNSKPLIICNGDLLHKINIEGMLEFHVKNNAFATMAVRDHHVDNPFGVVNTNGSVIKGFKEKPVKRFYVNAGIYIFNSNVIKYVKKNKRMDMPELFNDLIKKGKKTIIFPTYENWIDIGSYSEYKKINKKI